MAGPRYTIAQTRARVAALEIAADHLEQCVTTNEIELKQFCDVIIKLRNEAFRLKMKAQEQRRGKQLLHSAVRPTSHSRNVLPPTATNHGATDHGNLQHPPTDHSSR